MIRIGLQLCNVFLWFFFAHKGIECFVRIEKEGFMNHLWSIGKRRLDFYYNFLMQITPACQNNPLTRIKKCFKAANKLTITVRDELRKV